MAKIFNLSRPRSERLLGVPERAAGVETSVTKEKTEYKKSFMYVENLYSSTKRFPLELLLSITLVVCRCGTGTLYLCLSLWCVEPGQLPHGKRLYITGQTPADNNLT